MKKMFKVVPKTAVEQETRIFRESTRRTKSLKLGDFWDLHATQTGAKKTVSTCRHEFLELPFRRVLWFSLFCFGALLTVGDVIFAENYYVDAVAGADENSGTTPRTAWKTLANVNTHDFEPGDVVALRAGQTWRETITLHNSGAEGKPITFTQYGRGENPKLLGSMNLADPAFWTEVQPGIWATKPDCVDIVGDYPAFGVGKWSNYTEGKAKTSWKSEKNAYGNWVNTILTHEPTNRDCDIQMNYASFTIEPGDAFRFHFRARLVRKDAEEQGTGNLINEEIADALVRSVRLIQAGQPWDGYGHVAHSNWTVGDEWTDFEVVLRTSVLKKKTDARLSFFIGPFLPKGSVFTFEARHAERAKIKTIGLSREVGNIVLTKNETTTNNRNELVAWKRWSVEELKNEADYYYDIPTARLYFKSKENPGTLYSVMEAAGKCNLFNLGKQEHIVVDGLTFAYSGGHGLRGGPNCRHCVVRNNNFLWIGGSWLYTRGPIPTRYGNGIEFWSGNEDLLIENNYFYQIYDTAMTNQGPDAGELKDMVWRKNRCEKCEQCYEIWFTSPDMTVTSLTVEDNIFNDSGYGWSHAQRPDKRATHFLGYGFTAKTGKITYRKNHLGRSMQHMLWFHNPRIDEFELNENVYEPQLENATDVPLFYWGGQPQEGVTFEQYRKLTGNDKDSVLGFIR